MARCGQRGFRSLFEGAAARRTCCCLSNIAQKPGRLGGRESVWEHAPKEIGAATELRKCGNVPDEWPSRSVSCVANMKGTDRPTLRSRLDGP